MNTLGLLIILGYCSLPTGDCDVASVQPKTAFVSMQECRTAALALDKDVKGQGAILGGSKLKPPFKAHAVCGTPEQLEELTIRLGNHLPITDDEDRPDRPGYFDPAPNGG